MSRSATSTTVATVSSLPRIRSTVTVAPSATPIAENRIHWCSGVSARVSASRGTRRSRFSLSGSDPVPKFAESAPSPSEIESRRSCSSTGRGRRSPERTSACSARRRKALLSTWRARTASNSACGAVPVPKTGTKSSLTRPRRFQLRDRLGSTERRRSRTYRAVGYTTAPVLKTSGVIASMQGSLCAWAARAPACAPVPAVVGVSVDPLLTMEVSRCHARTRAITQDTFTPANRTVLVRRDASGGVARVVSDVSVSCPRADAGLGNAPSRASASGSSRRYARHRQGRRRPEHLLRRDGALCGR
jgi:hypothetical protein